MKPTRHGLQLLDESRLADPRLADELGDLALTQASRSDGRLELRQLLFATDDRQLLGSFFLHDAGDHADAVGRDRPLLAFDQERLRRGLEAGRRAFEHLGGREDLARLGPRGQPCGEIDGVAHDGVGPASARTDVAGERRAAVDARTERQG